MTFDPIAYINEPRWMSSRLGLGRIRELLDRLGRPQDQLRFVHVAGTNGKGSTCSYLAAILQKEGYRTGLFTSPFIELFEERIRIDGRNISLADLAEVTLVVREQAESMDDHPTEFELMTAVALVYFARGGCDIVVLEVGLGGRLDSTNVIETPEVSVIARIGLDHTALLGNSLAAVAEEKAGIIKKGIPVVSWPQDAEAMVVVRQKAFSNAAELSIPDFSQLEIGAVERRGRELVRIFSYGDLRTIETKLLGSYQPQNAAVAIAAIEVLRQRGWVVSRDALCCGIAEAQWPGRFEILECGSKRPTLVVDGGHNPQGARALAASLADVFPGRKPVFLMGVLEDKNYCEMLEAIVPMASAFVAVSPSSPRALSAEKLAHAIEETSRNMVGCAAAIRPVVADGMDDAVAQARALAGPEGLICAFGSLYLIAALRAAL